MPNFMQAPNVPDLLSPKGFGVGDSSYYQPGSGTLGVYLGDQLSRLRERMDMQEQIAGKEQERFNAVVPNEIAESNLSGNIAKYLDTPQNVSVLGSGKLGEAYSAEAKGREDQGMVPHKLYKAGQETDALYKLQQENTRHDALSEALVLGQMIGGSTLHPALPQWKAAVGNVVKTFGFNEDSPEYQQAMQEWAIPSEATMGSFKQAMERSALQKQEHIRNLDTIRSKGEWAVKAAEASKTDKHTLEKADKVAWTAILNDATEMILKLEREKREMLTHKLTVPAGQREAFVKNINDYYNAKIRSAYAQKNLALRELGMKEEPEDLAPDIPDQSEQPQKGIPGKPSGNLKEVPPPKAASKSPVRKDRTGGDFPRMPMVPVESQLKILEEERAKILADTTYTEDERKRRLSQIDSDIKAAAARKF